MTSPTDKSSKIWPSGSANGATGRLIHSFQEYTRSLSSASKSLKPAQSGWLLQSHTLMERCRGDLLRWSRRGKKKRNGTFSRLSEQPTALVSETRHPGHPVSKERGRGGVRGESSREQERNRARLKDRNGPSNDWKREGDGEKWREGNGKRTPVF